MSQEAAPHSNTLKTERDRFVAFAFCWADILLELDINYNIVFSGGALSALLGQKDSDLVGKPITDVIAEDDHDLLYQAISGENHLRRVNTLKIRLKTRNAQTPPIKMMGYRVKEVQNHLFLAFRLGDSFGKIKELHEDEKSGLLQSDSYLEVAQSKIKKLAQTQDVEMTMLDLDQLQDIANSLGNEDGDMLINTVGTYLRTSSIDGELASRIDDNKFSLVHDGSLKVDDLQKKIAEMAKKASGGTVDLNIKTATMKLDAANISDEDLANGLTYAINQFKNSRGANFSVESLSRNMSDLVGEAYDKITNFKQLVKDHEFFIAFQPIIGSRDGKVHHYECLARFRGDKAGKSPYEYIVFAEETGLIPEFDLAMVKASLSWLGQQPKGKKFSLAVNVSGYSVGDKTYINGLLELLNNNPWCKGSLMFEITESARLKSLDEANTFIQNLRKMGFPVCLDDFGAGAASFQYLSTLEVDIVKLDGSAVRNAFKAPKGRAFLSALCNLCRDLKVDTIAEMIDDPRALTFVRECGVGYVQGYLFGKPSPNMDNFDPLPKAELFSKRALSSSSANASALSRL